MSLEWLNRSSWSSLKELLKKAILEDEEYVRSFIVKVGALTDGQAQKADEFINFRLEHQSLQQELEMVITIVIRIDYLEIIGFCMGDEFCLVSWG